MKQLSVFLMIVLTSTSCGRKNNYQEFAGTYKLQESGCTISITITASKDNLQYHIKTNELEKSGTVQLTRNGDEVYFRFTGLLGAEPKEEISAQYIDKRIIIQNYGNSLNEYIKFRECDLKYLELVKVKK